MLILFDFFGIPIDNSSNDDDDDDVKMIVVYNSIELSIINILFGNILNYKSQKFLSILLYGMFAITPIFVFEVYYSVIHVPNTKYCEKYKFLSL